MSEPSRRSGAPQSRGLVDAPLVRRAAGGLLHAYMRLVAATNRTTHLRNGELYRTTTQHHPVIYVSWHGNVMAAALAFGKDTPKVVAMTAPHADGQMAAAAMRGFGVKTITATGRNERQTEGTGGLAGFRQLLRALAEGQSVYLTAEIPPTRGRKVSRGVIRLARLSGRPIVAVAAATSRRTILERVWDKMQINHPFGDAVVIAAPPTYIGKDDDETTAAAGLKRTLDDLYAEALMRVDLRSPL